MAEADGDTRLAERRSQLAAVSFFQAEGGLRHVEQLSGGQQNQNFLVTVEDGRRYVVRVPGVDAAEHGQRAEVVHANAVAAHTGGLAPRTCFFDPASSLMITEFVDGGMLTVASLRETPDLMARAVAAIRRLHTAADVTFAPSKASDFLFGYDLELMEGWRCADEIQAASQFQALLKRWLDSMDKLAPCHQDLTPANLILDKASGEVLIIDWEWAGPGDPLCDLATFCALSEQDEEGEKSVISLYLDVPVAEIPGLALARVRLWRTWTALRGALWARKKAQSSHFGEATGPDDDYTSFAEQDIAAFSDLLASDDISKHMSVLQMAMTTPP